METKEILEGIKAVGDKIDLQKKEGQTAIEGVEKKMTDLHAEADKIIKDLEKKYDDQIKELTDTMTKDGKTLKEMSEAIDNFKKKQGKLSAHGSADAKTAVDVISDLIFEHAEEIKGIKKDQKMSFEVKAGNITIGNISTTGTATNIPYSQAPFGPVLRPARKVNIRDLVPVVNSSTGTFVYYRQTRPVGAGSFAFQGGQGNLKNQLDYNLQQVIVSADYLAGTARIAKQMLQDIPYMQSFVSGQLLEDYRRSESGAFIPTLVAGSTSVSPASTVTAEKIIQVIALLMGNDYDANGIVTDSTTWAKIMNTKPNDYSLPGGGAAVTIDAMGIVRFLGMPMLVQNNISEGDIIVGDFTKAIIIQAEGLSVGFFDQDQDNVVRNLITARVEARVAFAVLDSAAFDIFTAGTT